MFVLAAALFTSPLHASSPAHVTSQELAVPQSILSHASLPVHVTLHATPGGHLTWLQRFPETQVNAHVDPSQVPPAAPHAALHSVVEDAPPSLVGDGDPASLPGVAPPSSSEDELASAC